ncbi:MAG: riboflavin synthase [Planctomycetota bacterium]
MFTGIVERSSRVTEISAIPGGKRLKIALKAVSSASGFLDPWPDLLAGESISVDGACLTLLNDADHLAFDVIEETLRKTSLGQKKPGDQVHLERALRVGDRLGGHYVTGHIDTCGAIRNIESGDETIWVIEHDPKAPFQTVEKGSVTIDGVSLTVVQSELDHFSVALIPHTLAVTTFGDKKPGAALNLEMDHFGRWVKKLLDEQRSANS